MVEGAGAALQGQPEDFSSVPEQLPDGVTQIQGVSIKILAQHLYSTTKLVFGASHG